MDQIKVFLDSDVVISSLLSSTGASFAIITNPKVKKVISKAIKAEVEEVAKRLHIDLSNTKLLTHIQTQAPELKKETLINTYTSYVLDQEDAPVVAGADKTNSQFLLTHNLKHYLSSRIRKDLEVIVMKPGIFLQYLRSLES